MIFFLNVSLVEIDQEICFQESTIHAVMIEEELAVGAAAVVLAVVKVETSVEVEVVEVETAAEVEVVEVETAVEVVDLVTKFSTAIFLF
jgi:hypothetical protein